MLFRTLKYSFRTLLFFAVTGIIILLIWLIYSIFNFYSHKDIQVYNELEHADNGSISKFRVMTFNIRHGVGNDGTRDLSRVIRDIQESSPHIVALQEVDRNVNRSDFNDQVQLISRRLGYNYIFAPSAKLLNAEYGNAILSKFKFEDYEKHNLPSRLEPRTLIKAVVNINGTPISVYNTHLGLYPDERSRQINRIIQLIQREENEYILTGDFNAKYDEQSMDYFASELWTSREHRNFIRLDHEKGIDYIFSSYLLEPIEGKTIESNSSDHFPVITDFNIKPAKDPQKQ